MKKRVIFLMILAVALTGGVYFATEVGEKQAPELPDTIDLPELFPAAGFCTNVECDQNDCPGGCTETNFCAGPFDLGVRCCNDNGTRFGCPLGQTVHQLECACHGTGCDPASAVSNFCQ